MIKNILLVVLSVMFLSAGPNWERVNYRDSTVFSAFVTVDGKAAHVGDIVGAFVGQECRMITTVFINNDSAYVSAVIHGEKPETVQFKLWVKAEDIVCESKQTLLSKPSDGVYLYHLNFNKK